MRRPLLEINNLSIYKKNYSLILNSDFSIQTNEIVGLFGSSGSGKSVFSLFLLGLLNTRIFSFSAKQAVFNSSSGFKNLLLSGVEDFSSFRKKYVSLIFQDPSVSLNPTIICGKQIKECCFDIKPNNSFNYCLSLLDEVGIENPKKVFFSYPHELSGGQKQRVVIAIALASKPLLLIADEPTTSLDPSTQRSVLDLIINLKKRRSFSVVLISHNLDLIKYYCDRIFVLKNKNLISLDNPENKKHVRLLEDYLFKIKNRKFPLTNSSSGFFYKKFYKPNYSYPVIFKLEKLSVSFKNKPSFFALKDLSLSVFAGDCLGIVGSSGSGKTTLGRVFCGINKNYSGFFDFPSHNNFLQKSVQMVYQDPFSSFNPKYTVGDSVLEIINLYNSNLSVYELFSLVSLKEDYIFKYPHELSGGQKQRVSIARVLASNPSVIVFDESLSGLDIEVEFSILELIRFINNKLKITVIFISHDLNSVYYLCNRIIVLKNGEITDSFNSVDLFLNNRNNYTKKLLSDSNFI